MEIILIIFIFVAFFITFFIPGRVALGEQKDLPGLAIFALSVILGIVLWGWQGFIFGFLKLRSLSYVYLLLFILVFLKNGYLNFVKKRIIIEWKKFDWLTISIASIGIIAQLLPFVRMGQSSSQGLFIIKYNQVDHIWHASLIEELTKRFPPFEPGMSGVLLKNYHFWFNLVTADVIRVFHLPLFQTQFIGMYAIGSIMLGIIAYLFATSLNKSKIFVRLFLFLLYLSGDAALWFMLIQKKQFSFQMESLIDDATKFMDSPARGFSVIIALAALYVLFTFHKRMSWKNITICALLFGSLIGFKIYTGIPFLLGLLCLALFDFTKKNNRTLIIFFIALLLSLIQFLPFNASSGGLFFLPFEIPRGFIAQKQLGLSYIDQRWRIYTEHHNFPRLVEYGILMSVLYLIIQFGIKIIGFLPFKKLNQTLDQRKKIILFTILGSSVILGLFFYQKIGGANIWEFFLTASIILTIFTALTISQYLPGNKILRVLVLSLVVAITIPRWIYSVSTYIQSEYLSGFHGISNREMESYLFLKNQTPKNSLVLIMNQTKYTGYSSIDNVLTGRDLFFSGQGVSQSRSQEYLKRQHDIDLIKNAKDPAIVNSTLKKNNINYLYFYKYPDLKADLTKLSITKEFSSDHVSIYKVIY